MTEVTAIWYSFNTNAQWKAYLQKLLWNNEAALLRALVLIDGFQTDDEKVSKMSLEDNNVGFTKWDAGMLSILAEKVKSNIKLTPNELVLLKYKMPKYWKQLMTIAKAKQQAQIQSQLEPEVRMAQAQITSEQLQLCMEHNIPCSYGICEECVMQY